MASNRFAHHDLGRFRIVGIAVAAALLGYADARAGSARLTWTAPGDDGNSGQATAYELRYSTSAVAGTDTASWWSAAAPVGGLPRPQVGGTMESFTVAGLDSGRAYYFILRTSDEVPNVSAFSNIATRVAMGDVTYTLASPQQFRAQATSTAVLLSWNAVPSDAGTEYRLYRKGHADTSPQFLTSLSLATTSWTDSIVGAGLTYEYRIATYGGGLEGTPAIIQVSVPRDGQSAGIEVHGFPNPAHGSITLRFIATLPPATTAHTRLTVFDLSGHRIRELLDDVLGLGEHDLVWDCRSSAGEPVAPGLYNVILESPSGRAVAHLGILP